MRNEQKDINLLNPSIIFMYRDITLSKDGRVSNDN